MLSLSAKNNLKSIFSNLIWICIAGYFVYHIIIGARGVVSWTILSREANQLESELTKIKKENEFMNNKIRGMRSDSLDLDLLEEQAQRILGFCYPEDTVVLLPQDI